MMIHAYQEIYLSKTQSMLGEAFDYAINFCHIGGKDFINFFITSTISKQIETGDITLLLGKSGIDIVIEIINEVKNEELQAKPYKSFIRSKEYWIGWAIAYYQWETGRKYSEIFTVLSFDDLENMYYTLHEADISKFVDVVNSIIKEYYTETNLKRIRLSYGISQAKLAKYSGVSLRSIQMYEQRNKDINKARVETIYRLSKVLGCTMEDLLEK